MIARAFALPEVHLLASSGVQVFWFFCLLLVLFQVWRGWRTGLFRELAGVVGLLAGWVIGLSQGPAFFAHFWAGSKVPSFIVVPFASMILGLIVYALAILAGKMLFKRACDHPFGPTRLFLGGGGALVGFFLGLFGVWMVIAVARLGGSIAQGELPAPASPATGKASQSLSIQREADRRDTAARRLSESTAPTVVRIQRSVESGLIGDVTRFTDPFPQETYTDLSKMARIANDPDLQQRLWEVPSMREIASDPRVMALRQDPAVMNALQSGDYLGLINNANLRAAFNDPHLSRRLQKVDLTRVLNETVQ